MGTWNPSLNIWRTNSSCPSITKIMYRLCLKGLIWLPRATAASCKPWPNRMAEYSHCNSILNTTRSTPAHSQPVQNTIIPTTIWASPWTSRSRNWTSITNLAISWDYASRSSLTVILFRLSSSPDITLYLFLLLLSLSSIYFIDYIVENCYEFVKIGSYWLRNYSWDD